MFNDLKQYWKNDFLAAVNVALVALPLGLGIASAGGIPPISGVISAIIGGIVCSFIRGSKVAINGPGNGMIAVVISAMIILNPYGEHAFNYLLAAFIVSGGFMILFGLLKLGRFGDNFPSTVVMGLLAGIGIIIMLKQLKPGFGTSLDLSLTGDYLSSIHIPDMIIFLGTVIILAIYEFIPFRLIKFVPGPVWVLLFAIPFVLFFDLPNSELSLADSVFEKGNNFFVSVPNIFEGVNSVSSLFAKFPFPDFSIINTLGFWTVVLSVTLVGSLESLLSAKAIEKLDPLERKVDMNKDLLALGLGTIVSGFVGGMPVNTVIARSSVNINSGAKTSFANFFQGVLLLVALIYLSDYLGYIPFAALAGILIVTGFKLTKPKIYKDAFLHGWEQLVILLITLGVTFFFGLINGVLIGMVFNLILHVFYFEGNAIKFFRLLFKPNLKTVDNKDTRVFVRLYGILNFLNIQPLESLLKAVPPGKNLTIDFSHLKLVDLTVLEFVRDFAKDYRNNDGSLESVGLDAHYTTSIYPHSLHYLSSDKKKLTRVQRKTLRQDRLEEFATENGWKFKTPIVWDTPDLDQFSYFKQHPIEYTSNVILGSYDDLKINWEISDMTFDDGAFIETKELHTTEHLIKLPIQLPPFVLDKEFLYDKLLDILEDNDIDFEDYPEFSKKFVLRSSDEEGIRKVFGKDVIQFFRDHDVYHVECIGNMLMIFRQNRLASVNEIKSMITYTHDLCAALLKYGDSSKQ